MAAADLARRARCKLVAAALAGLVAAACGQGPNSTAAAPSASASAVPGTGCQQVGTVPFDKTKFVFHAGLAFGAFHHFIYNPYKAGTLHGVVALTKAGLAGLFTVHELKLAKADAESSPTLCHLVAPFDQASTALNDSINSIKSGKASGQDLDGLNNDINGVQNGAAADGVPAPDRVPTNAQLASGSA